MERRVRFAPGTKTYNAIPEWFPKSKPSFDTKTIRKRIAVMDLIRRIDQAIRKLKLRTRLQTTGRSTAELRRLVTQLHQDRMDLVQKLHMLDQRKRI